MTPGPQGAATADSAGRAIVLHPLAAGEAGGEAARLADGRLREAAGLARAIGLEVAHSEIVPLRRARPATLFGRGVVERLHGQVAATGAGLVVVDTTLTPVQQRNLERALDCKVIDRTALILEIFGARARTREGRLQVELAHLTWQRSRLVRSWTHLERQRGGRGFLGGPGERQLEIDRRLIGRRITRLKRDLETVRRRRGLQRRARRRVPWPVVALVGYTNAGKSTLFNRLTGAGALASPMLFATLDPTMRGLRLPSGRRIILSDTVGFISDLPTALVAAFRATLEEVTEADILLHIRDMSDPEEETRKADVERVLAALGMDAADAGAAGDSPPVAGGRPVVQVLNKIDALDATGRERVAAIAARRNQPFAMVSALTGEGQDTLVDLLDRLLDRDRRVVEYRLDPADGAAIAWLYRRGEVLERDDADDGIRVKVSLDRADVGRFARHGNRPVGDDAPAG